MSSSSSSVAKQRPVCNKTCFSISASLGNDFTATNKVGTPASYATINDSLNQIGSNIKNGPPRMHHTLSLHV